MVLVLVMCINFWGKFLLAQLSQNQNANIQNKWKKTGINWIEFCACLEVTKAKPKLYFDCDSRFYFRFAFSDFVEISKMESMFINLELVYYFGILKF